MERKKPGRQQKQSKKLRQRAEKLLPEELTDSSAMTAGEAQAMLHELHVHQVELEIQNEELRHAQLELANSLDRYTELFNLSPIGYLTVNKDGQIQEANLTAATMLGVDRKTLQRSKIWKFIAPELRDNVYLHLHSALASEAKQRCEIEMLQADGSRLHVGLESIAVDQHQQRQCLTALIDISERKLAEQALSLLNINLQQSLHNTSSELRESIDKLKLIDAAVTNLGEGVMITSDSLEWPDPTIIYTNPAMSYISGYSEKELIGRTPGLLHGRDTDAGTLEHIKSELMAGRPVLTRLKNYQKDGTVYDTEIYIGPLFDDDGKRTHFVSIHRDITDSMQAERELKNNQARLKAILETAAEAIITIDEHGIIDSINTKAETMFGYSSKEMLNNNVSMIMPSPYREQHDSYIQNFLRTREAHIIGHSRESLARRRNGTNFPVSISISQIGNKDRFAGFIQDLTEVKALQRQVLDAAAEEDRRIGQELHDNLQQQLTGLSLLASSLTESLADTTPQYAHDVARLDGGIRKVIDQVQLLSRGLIPVDVDANGLSVALEQLTESLCLGTKSKCGFHTEGDCLLSNNRLATHLYRIAQEAVNNVIKHSQATRFDMRLKCDNEWIILDIEDNGVGTEKSYREQSGLGLRMMRYRAQLIGADLYIGPGKHAGTRVSCTIPANTAATYDLA